MRYKIITEFLPSPPQSTGLGRSGPWDGSAAPSWGPHAITEDGQDMQLPSLRRGSDPVPAQNEVFTLGWLLGSIQGGSGRRRDVRVCEGLKVNQREK